MPFLQNPLVCSSIVRSEFSRFMAIARKPGRIVRVGLLAALMTAFPGCQSLPGHSRQRAAQCGALCEQAKAAREKGNLEQANRYVDEALNTRSNDLETRLQLAETLWKNGRHPEAVAQFEALYDRHPNDAKLAIRRATVLWESNRHTEAGVAAAAALELDPQSKDAWLVKARSEAERGELDDALVSCMRLWQIAPDDLSTQLELAELHLRRDHADRARPLFRTAMQHSGATPKQRSEIEWRLGVAYARSERWAAAITSLEHSIASRQASAEEWCFLGSTRYQAGDWAGARSALQRAVQRDPDSTAARTLAAQLETGSGHRPVDGRVTPAGFRLDQ